MPQYQEGILTPIPAVAKGEPPPGYWQHLGLYGYTRAALLEFVRRPQSPLERIERLTNMAMGIS